MKNEVLDEMLPDAYEIDIIGNYEKYINLLCNHEMPKYKMLPVMYQAASLYLNYRAENSEINNYIRNNINKKRNMLIKDLMNTFPRYGLGDLQFGMMIDNVMKGNRIKPV